MKKLLLIVIYFLPLLTHAQTPYWQQEVDNVIDVSLNDVENTLDGFIKINYTNNSPDTLHFIWFHLWPNAFKTDRTAFSEQMLQNGKTDFYFSDKDSKGYINHLDFRVDQKEARTEDHPLYLDVIKLLLPNPLPPGKQIQITTPFHEKLPFNFSRGGHEKQSYQITQWYPKPAVYDSKGWHEMPYLDQGEFYSEFGSFDVRITLPKNYVVAATGELQNEEEKKWLMNKVEEARIKKQGTRDKGQGTRVKKQGTRDNVQGARVKKQGTRNKKQEPVVGSRESKVKEQETRNKKQTGQEKPSIYIFQKETKTLQFKQNNIHDFAWFADKNFIVDHDTLQMPSGKIVDAYSFYLPEENSTWTNSIQYIKKAIRFRSDAIGEYSYNTISIVEAKTGIDGGMEYPTITSIPPQTSPKKLEATIAHEIGHNWFYAALANNERDEPWMDEGMNTFYDNKYSQLLYEKPKEVFSSNKKWITNRLPDDIPHTLIETMAETKKDQPIDSRSEDFSKFNYGLMAYSKASEWMQMLENDLGPDLFETCMKQYYKQWQFKHPDATNFKNVFEKESGKNLDSLFSLLSKKGNLQNEAFKKKIKLAFLFNLKETDKYNYLSLMPAIGYNMYDQFMIGAVFHNYSLPPHRLEFAIAPLYATNSKQLNGIGDIHYSWYPNNKFQKIQLGINGARFSTLSGIDSNGNNIFGGFYKIVPSIRFVFPKENARSSMEKWLDFRTFLIGEKAFNYFYSTSDSNYHPTPQKYSFRYLNQLTFNIEDHRVLYPYNVQLQLQQASQWYRLNFTTDYFFNYSKGGGMSVRIFAAKFGFIGALSSSEQFSTYYYQPKLTASTGSDDYTYSNYFIGRNQYNGLASQQVMLRDGGLMLRTDLFQNLQGRSSNWVSAINMSSTLPKQIVPEKFPLKIFFDLGSYAEAWGNNPPTSKFLYVSGLQLSLVKNIINIYAPLFYSTAFSSQLKTVPDQNGFFKKISFSIDVQNIQFRKLFKPAVW